MSPFPRGPSHPRSAGLRGHHRPPPPPPPHGQKGGLRLEAGTGPTEVTASVMAEPRPESGPEGWGPTAQDSGGRGARHGASVPRLHSRDGRGAFQGLNETTLSVLGSTLPAISQVSAFVPSVFTAYSPRSRHWAGCGVATGDKASLCTARPCDKGSTPRSLSGGASHVTSTAPGGWALPVRLTGEEVKAQVHSGTCRTRPGHALPPCEHPALLRPPPSLPLPGGRAPGLAAGHPYSLGPAPSPHTCPPAPRRSLRQVRLPHTSTSNAPQSRGIGFTVRLEHAATSRHSVPGPGCHHPPPGLWPWPPVSQPLPLAWPGQSSAAQQKYDTSRAWKLTPSQHVTTGERHSFHTGNGDTDVV